MLRGGSGADLLVSNGVRTKQLIGEGINDGGAAGLDTYRIIGSGATAGAQVNLILNYQIGENVEVNSLTARGVSTVTINGVANSAVTFQSTTAGVAHATYIPVGADSTANRALAQSILNGMLANDADGPDLIISPGLTADSLWA